MPTDELLKFGKWFIVLELVEGTFDVWKLNVALIFENMIGLNQTKIMVVQLQAVETNDRA